MNNIYFEIIAFFYAIKHPDLISTVKTDFFSEPTIKNVFNIAKDFVTKYKAEPSAAQIIEIINLQGKSTVIPADTVNSLWNNKSALAQYDEEWLDTNIPNWCKWRSFYTGLEKTIAYVQSLPPTMSFEDSAEYIAKAKNLFTIGAAFTTNTSKGHDFFDISTHTLAALNTRTTGYSFLDKSLNGGYSNKTLVVLMGGPKTGKSMWLCNLAAQSVKNGYNTLYITLELPYQKVSQRIGANMFNIPMAQYNETVKDNNLFAKKVQEFRANQLGKLGTFILEEFPTSTATAEMIEAFAVKKQEEISALTGKDFKFDNVYIDYLNIMRDMKNPNSENTYLKIKSICEDVRAMAQRNEWCVISVTQTNRGGTESSDLNMTDVSESAGLTATVDALFGIIRTTMMRAEGCYYLKAVAMRDSPLMGCKKRYTFNDTYLRLAEDLTEEIIADGVDIPSIYVSATANGVAKYQQNNRGYNNNPTPQQPAPIQQGTPLIQTPQLGISESQLTGADLFKM